MKITVPDNWSQVSLDQYMKISELKDVEENIIEIVSILSKVPLEEAGKWTPEDFAKILPTIEWIFKMPDESKYNTEIKVGETTYNLIDLSDLKVKEWIELVFCIKDYNKYLDKIFSILYKPEEKPSKDFKRECMIGDVYGALVFFCHIEREYLTSMQRYLADQIQKTKTIERKSKKNRIKRKLKLTLIFLGMSSFTLLQKEIF